MRQFFIYIYQYIGAFPKRWWMETLFFSFARHQTWCTGKNYITLTHKLQFLHFTLFNGKTWKSQSHFVKIWEKFYCFYFVKRCNGKSYWDDPLVPCMHPIFFRKKWFTWDSWEPCSTQYLQWKPHVFDNADLLLLRDTISGFFPSTAVQVLSLGPQSRVSSVLVFMHHMGRCLDLFLVLWLPSGSTAALIMCHTKYKSNRVLGTVQLRDYSHYVILLFGKYS